MEKKISVIIPVFNSENTLDKCINSVLTQNYNEVEIILVYNKSTDKSLEKCKRYALNCKNIILIENKSNYGPGFARNQGIRRASGYFIYFMDSDDYLIDKSAFHILTDNMEKNNSTFCMAGYRRTNSEKIFKNTGEVEILSQEDALNYVLSITDKRVEGYLWNKLFVRKNILDNKIFFNVHFRMWEDLLFCVEYILTIKKAVFLDKVIYMYCQNPRSISSSISLNKALEWCEAGLKICTNLNTVDKNIQQKFINNFVNVCMQCVIIDVQNNNKITKSSKYLQLIKKNRLALRKKYKVAFFLIRLRMIRLVCFIK